MNTKAFQHFYDYHFAENRSLWDSYIAHLPSEQFTQPVGASPWSIRDQIVHLMSVDEIWFRELRGLEPTAPFPPADGDDRAAIRSYWDGVEQSICDYLAQLSDEMLFAQPITEPDEDRDLLVWQVLLHVGNHGTDHRAQLLRSLNDLGLKTTAQDYIFYVYDHPWKG